MTDRAHVHWHEVPRPGGVEYRARVHRIDGIIPHVARPGWREPGIAVWCVTGEGCWRFRVGVVSGVEMTVDKARHRAKKLLELEVADVR